MTPEARPLPVRHEQRLAEDRADIVAKIEHGFAQAERGELFDPDGVRARLSERKQAWMDQNKRA